jgi:hypothetical protein
MLARTAAILELQTLKVRLPMRSQITRYFLFICLSVVAVSSYAQQSVQLRSQNAEAAKLYAAKADIPVLTTRPATTQARAPERLRHKSRAVDEAPAPLDSQQFLVLTGKETRQSSGTKPVKAAGEPTLEYLELTPRKLLSGMGWLEFSDVQRFDPKDQYVSFFGVSSDLVGTVQAFLKVEKGQRYLLDFSINAGVHSTFEISSNGGTQVTSVDKGPRHLLIYLDAQGTETTEVSLSAKNAIYSFYSLEVTRVD